jgi:hypothetical protein
MGGAPSNVARTEGFCRVRIVKIPKAVPKGIDKQLIPDITMQ